MDGGGDFGIKLSFAEPAKDDWVGVKVEKHQVSGRGRVQMPPFKVYMYWKNTNSVGMMVSFAKEKCKGFFYFPDVEDLSYPVLWSEIVVLNSPKPLLQNCLAGFQFPNAIMTSITAYSSK